MPRIARNIGPSVHDRETIVAFLAKGAAHFDARATLAASQGDPQSVAVARLMGQANCLRVAAEQIARGEDRTSLALAKPDTVTSTTPPPLQPLPPLTTVGPMQNRGAQ